MSTSAVYVDMPVCLSVCLSLCICAAVFCVFLYRRRDGVFRRSVRRQPSSLQRTRPLQQVSRLRLRYAKPRYSAADLSPLLPTNFRFSNFRLKECRKLFFYSFTEIFKLKCKADDRRTIKSADCIVRLSSA